MMTEEELSSRCWDTIKSDGIFLPNKSEQKSDEEEDSAMAAFMKSTDEETETNCRLVRDVIESQKEQKEKQF